MFRQSPVCRSKEKGTRRTLIAVAVAFYLQKINSGNVADWMRFCCSRRRRRLSVGDPRAADVQGRRRRPGVSVGRRRDTGAG